MRALRRIDAFELIRLAPAVGVLAVWIALMPAAGGFRPGAWLPAGLVLAALLALAAVGSRTVLPPAGTARWALGFLAAFTGWCFLSIAWSDAPGTTWEASNLLLVALLGGWTLALAPWRPRSADLLMGGLSLAAAVVCLVALLSALSAADLTSRFEDFRFTPPLDYPNSSAAFGFMAAIGALVLASRADLPPVARGGAQGVATFLAAFALLPQSRGSVLGGAAALLVLVIAVPGRWRLVMHTALLAVALLVASGPVFDVYTTGAQTGKASGALGDATLAIALVAVACAIAGGLLAVAQARLRVGERGRRAARLAAAVGLVAVVAGIGAAGASHSTQISAALNDQWRSLKHPGVRFKDSRGGGGESSGRLLSTDPLERYDYWRVAAGGFRSAPLGGLGAGGFEHRYTADRRYPKSSKYPHNLALKVLGDTGIVGVLLIGGFAGALAAGMLRRRTMLPAPERGVLAAALGVFAYFVAHGLFDWLEAYPVLAGPALGLPLMALAVRDRADRIARVSAGERRLERGNPPTPHRPGPARPVALLAGVGLAVAALSLLAPWIALRYRERAAERWRTQPGPAYSDLRRAATLDPLNPRPLVLQGVIGLTRGDLDRARSGFAQALDREQAWLPHFGLAVVAAAAGDAAVRDRELARAGALDPLDPNLPRVARKLRKGGPVDPAALVREVLASPLFAAERVT